MPEAEVRIKEVIRRAPGVKSFRLQMPEGVEFKAGQFMCVSLEEEKECKRYLSISSSPTEKCYLEFTKRITESKFSRAIDHYKPGQALRIQYPLGKFTLEDNGVMGGDKVAFLSGGIGITPIRSIAKSVVDKKMDIDMVLVYANRSIREIIFREDFDAMENESPKLKVAHVLCEPAEGFKCSVGLINQQIIKDEIPDYRQRKFFLCGPPGMVEAMRKILSQDLGLPQEAIVTENFVGY